MVHKQQMPTNSVVEAVATQRMRTRPCLRLIHTDAKPLGQRVSASSLGHAAAVGHEHTWVPPSLAAVSRQLRGTWFGSTVDGLLKCCRKLMLMRSTRYGRFVPVAVNLTHVHAQRTSCMAALASAKTCPCPRMSTPSMSNTNAGPAILSQAVAEQVREAPAEHADEVHHTLRTRLWRNMAACCSMLIRSWQTILGSQTQPTATPLQQL